MLHFTKNFKIAEDIKAIITLSRKKTPFLDSFKAGKPLTGETLIWYETFSMSDEGTLTSQLDGSSLTLNVNPELASSAVKGTIIMIDGEQLMVVSKTTNTLTVESRGYGSTPATAHDNGAKVYILSKAEADGEITDDFNKLVKVERKNYLQEFTKSIHITERALILKQKDYLTVKGEELLDKTDVQRSELNKQLIYGKPVLDLQNWRNSMGGILHAIATGGGVVLDAGKDLTEEKFSQFLVNLANRGSNVTHILLNPAMKEVIFRKFKNTIYETADGQKNQKGGGNMTGYIANALDGRELQFIVDTHVKTSDMIFYCEHDNEFCPAQKDGKDILLSNDVETESSAVYKSTVRTIGSAMFKDANKAGYISNIA